MRRKICFIAMLTLSAAIAQNSIFPRADKAAVMNDFFWRLEISPHAQRVQRPDKNGESEFYQKFRDFDDFTKHANRPSYISFALGKKFNSGWEIQSQIAGSPNWLQTDQSVRFPQSLKDLDYSVNDIAFVRKSSENYSVKFGRDFLVWDPERTGTILPNTLSSFDHFRLDYWTKTWYYHAFWGDIDARDNYAAENGFSKSLIGHRLELFFLEKFTFYVAEIVIVARNLSFAEMNPLFQNYHNLELNWRLHNIITSFEFSAEIAKDSKIFLHIDLDEMESKSVEYNLEENSNPNTWAAQAGFISPQFQAVVTKTSAWMYNHHGKKLDSDNTFVLVESFWAGEMEKFYRFIGYPLGGGVLVAESNLNIWNFTLGYRWMQRTPNHILDDVDFIQKTEPTETRNRFSLCFEKQIQSKTNIYFSASAERVNNFHHNATDTNLFEILAGLRFCFGAQPAKQDKSLPSNTSRNFSK